jgi:hypothetical protein
VTRTRLRSPCHVCGCVRFRQLVRQPVGSPRSRSEARQNCREGLESHRVCPRAPDTPSLPLPAPPEPPDATPPRASTSSSIAFDVSAVEPIHKALESLHVLLRNTPHLSANWAISSVECDDTSSWPLLRHRLRSIAPWPAGRSASPQHSLRSSKRLRDLPRCSLRERGSVACLGRRDERKCDEPSQPSRARFAAKVGTKSPASGPIRPAEHESRFLFLLA